MASFLEGFLLQASLIMALGSQNLFVIEMGIKRQYHALIAAICAFCDVCLIMLGVFGVSTFLVQASGFKIALGLTGVSFLIYYSIAKLREAFSSSSSSTAAHTGIISRNQAIIMALSFTLLNPHVYLDTFVLIGGYSSKFDEPMQKYLFGGGAGSFSIVWFFFISTFSAKFSSLLKTPKFLRGLALFSGIILGYLAIKLGMESITELRSME